METVPWPKHFVIKFEAVYISNDENFLLSSLFFGGEEGRNLLQIRGF